MSNSDVWLNYVFLTLHRLQSVSVLVRVSDVLDNPVELVQSGVFVL